MITTQGPASAMAERPAKSAVRSGTRQYRRRQWEHTKFCMESHLFSSCSGNAPVLMFSLRCFRHMELRQAGEMRPGSLNKQMTVCGRADGRPAVEQLQEVQILDCGVDRACACNCQREARAGQETPQDRSRKSARLTVPKSEIRQSSETAGPNPRQRPLPMRIQAKIQALLRRGPFPFHPKFHR